MQRSKTAARRGLTLIRELIEQGKHEAAHRLAKQPGVLKDSPLGSMIKMLSTAGSAEGPAVLTAHPTRGLAATKYYHPQGITTPDLVRAKERLAKIEHPANTPLLGSSYMKGLDLPVHHFEYVPGKTVDELGIMKNPALVAKAQRDVKALRRQARLEDIDVTDLHDKNIMLDTKGQGRLIDSLPYLPGHPKGVGVSPILNREPKELYIELMRKLEAQGMELQPLGPPPKLAPETLLSGTPANIPKRPPGTHLF